MSDNYPQHTTATPKTGSERQGRSTLHEYVRAKPGAKLLTSNQIAKLFNSKHQQQFSVNIAHMSARRTQPLNVPTGCCCDELVFGHRDPISNGLLTWTLTYPHAGC